MQASEIYCSLFSMSEKVDWMSITSTLLKLIAMLIESITVSLVLSLSQFFNVSRRKTGESGR